MKTLKEFYDDIEPGEQVSFYNKHNELILNKNNVCDCDEIVELYGDLTTYSYEISQDVNGKHIYITLDKE